ncbi:uncharacterized protein LOC110271481 [Arachis ipaensis]|uniref:uncharacterized protein LOC110271481 n=1 Tax=Arachis ipaensis TaxID=130454 RepID=UPI000A2B72D7|nr:uncharacterized protein LOC110271481 [Arachis ipaensis]
MKPSPSQVRSEAREEAAKEEPRHPCCPRSPPLFAAAGFCRRHLASAGEHEEREIGQREREDSRGSHRRKEFAAASRCLRRCHSSSLLPDAIAVREEERELALPLDPPFLTVSVAAVSALLLPPPPRGATPLCFWPSENLVAVAGKTLPLSSPEIWSLPPLEVVTGAAAKPVERCWFVFLVRRVFPATATRFSDGQKHRGVAPHGGGGNSKALTAATETVRNGGSNGNASSLSSSRTATASGSREDE